MLIISSPLTGIEYIRARNDVGSRKCVKYHMLKNINSLHKCTVKCLRCRETKDILLKFNLGILTIINFKLWKENTKKYETIATTIRSSVAILSLFRTCLSVANY